MKSQSHVEWINPCKVQTTTERYFCVIWQFIVYYWTCIDPSWWWLIFSKYLLSACTYIDKASCMSVWHLLMTFQTIVDANFYGFQCNTKSSTIKPQKNGLNSRPIRSSKTIELYHAVQAQIFCQNDLTKMESCHTHVKTNQMYLTF